ncbi:MAG: Hsp20/alpha crystallin family protein [Anaerolineae bacterium]|nr:Hsp20/alpha crystallin family protein [Anaerolineae bacterium]MDW8100953.1 Hsp20/alpha crystallin family protein [Anaerolineae bacterium]
MAGLVRWNPYRSWLTLREAMDRLLEEAFVPTWSELLRWPEPSFAADLWPFAADLSVDMYETEDDVVIRATLPGVREDEVDIEERDGTLTIRVESKTEDERTAFGWHIRERGYGLWQRTLRLPVRVKAEKARAELEHGILTIRLPKARARKPLVKKIRVGGFLPKIRWPRLGKRARAIPVIVR